MNNATPANSANADSRTGCKPFQRLSKCLAVAAFAFGAHSGASAAVFTEDFNAPFPAWEAGFFGLNSNAVNAVCNARGCPDRGNNNQDGLYVAGPGQTGAIDVAFNTGFANTITTFDLDVAAVFNTTLLAFDVSDTEIFRAHVDASDGPFITSASYKRFSIVSANGISRFGFTDDSAVDPSSAPPAGSTVIDNLLLTTRDPVTLPPGAVPEPGSLALLGIGLAGFMVMRRKATGRYS